MKKAITFFLLLSLCGGLFCGCGEKGSRRYDYDLEKYVSLAQWDKVKARFSPADVCTEEEIDGAVFQILLTYADFAEKEGGVVELYDKVLADYAILYDGKALDEYSQSDYAIIVGYEGNGDIDAALAKEMLGKQIGDECAVAYTFPESDVSLGSWAGQTVECRGKICAIYSSRVPECTDEVVAGIGSFGFGTVEEFRESLRQDILEQKEEAKAQAVLDAFLAGVTVKEYPREETQAYVQKYISELQDAAESLGLHYDEYLKDYLEIDEDEASRLALSDARDRVKKDMACIQASRLMKVELTKEEYEKGLATYYEKEADLFDSKEDFEAYYTKDILWDCILWDKTFSIMLERAEPLT